MVAACGAAGEPETHAFEVEIRDRALVGETIFTVRQGDRVTFHVISEEAGDLHVHGYDYEVGFSPDVPALLVFDAYATGRFEIAMHPGHAHSHDNGESHGHEHDHGDHGHGEGSCAAEVEGAEVRLTVTPGEELNRFLVRVETNNFPLGQDGNHWHLYVKGDIHGMYEGPEAEVTLSQGAHLLEAVLSDGDHCDLPHRRAVMVGVQSPGHDHDNNGHDHEDVPLGHLEVRP